MTFDEIGKGIMLNKAADHWLLYVVDENKNPIKGKMYKRKPGILDILGFAASVKFYC